MMWTNSHVSAQLRTVDGASWSSALGVVGSATPAHGPFTVKPIADARGCPLQLLVGHAWEAMLGGHSWLAAYV